MKATLQASCSGRSRWRRRAGRRATCSRAHLNPPGMTRSSWLTTFKSSRLHFIGTWKARIEALAARSAGDPPLCHALRVHITLREVGGGQVNYESIASLQVLWTLARLWLLLSVSMFHCAFLPGPSTLIAGGVTSLS